MRRLRKPISYAAIATSPISFFSYVYAFKYTYAGDGASLWLLLAVTVSHLLAMLAGSYLLQDLSERP